MRRLMVRCAVLVAGVALAVGGGAAAASAATAHQPGAVQMSGRTGQDKPVGVVVDGTIIAIDTGKPDEQVLTVTTAKGKMGVLVTPKTSVTSGTKGEPATLNVGETVTAKGFETKQQLIEALVVIVR